ncbi:hypothetical protein FN846DRAFT_910228 [Sphaerosporella brunnea]|uniref:Uncharacterized protein n=1 Tax=Sphaerosporella brunnea TaxID=1250544 RepID=A0A5J5EMS7_9PEZI|nr:hypothetical protein FN846DRAFT_910228 [Sphaerosporella brunnea]
MHPSAPQTTAAAGTFNAQPTSSHLQAGHVETTNVERMRSLIAGFINGRSLPTSETKYLRAQQYGALLLVLQEPNPECLAAVETACCQSCKALRFEYNARSKLALLEIPSVLHQYAGNGFFSSAVFDVLSPAGGKRLRVKSHS